MADYGTPDDTPVTPSVSAAMLAAVKLALRITATAYDAEITGLIEAAMGDMIISGVAMDAFTVEVPEPLVKQAVIMYCKANFGLDNPDSEKYMKAFRSLETDLALSSEYQDPVL